MKYFYDCEFIEDGKTIELISIGVTDLSGNDFYAESSEVDLSKANDFVKEWVVPNLEGECSFNFMSRADIKRNLLHYFGTNKVELWSWFGAYDHVCLAQLFGRMVDMPGNLPWFTRELEQIRNGQPLPPNKYTQHHSLSDAWWHRNMWYAWADPE